MAENPEFRSSSVALHAVHMQKPPCTDLGISFDLNMLLVRKERPPSAKRTSSQNAARTAENSLLCMGDSGQDERLL